MYNYKTKIRDANYAERPELALPFAKQGGYDNLKAYARSGNVDFLNAADTYASIGCDLFDLIATSGENATPSEWQVEPPKERLDDLAGMEEVKRIIREQIIAPLKLSERAKTFEYDPEFAIQLFGPSGCGKTTFAKCIAGELGIPVFVIKPSDVYSRYVGDSEARINALFTEIGKHKSCLAFFDENDATFPDDDEEKTKVLQELNIHLDGFKSRSTRLILVGASNKPWKLAPSAISRFERAVYVPLPDKPARLGILRREFGNAPLNEEVALDDIADLTQSFSGRELRTLVRSIKAIATARGDNSPLEILSEDVMKALTPMHPSTPPGRIKLYELWERDKWSSSDFKRHFSEVQQVPIQSEFKPNSDPEPSFADADPEFFVDPAPFAATPFFRV